MTYLVDAQLPKKLAVWMTTHGYAALHTLDLPDRNDTDDVEIIRLSTVLEKAVIVSKDRDFPEYRLVRNLPERLLWVTTENINNKQLLDLFIQNFVTIDAIFREGKQFIELSNLSIIIHE